MVHTGAMYWVQVLVQALPAVTALVFVLGSLWWGRQVVEAKKEALAAKHEQIRTKEAEIALLERLAPTRMVEHLQALNTSYAFLLDRAKDDAKRQLADVEQTAGEERAQAQAQLDASQQRIQELEARVASSEAALKKAEIVARDWKRVQLALGSETTNAQIGVRDLWEVTLKALSPKMRAHFSGAQPTLEGNRLVLSFPYAYRHKVDWEGFKDVAPILQSLWGNSFEIHLRLEERPTYAEGERVVHPKFGSGVIINSARTATGNELVVRFDEAGVKILNADVAPLSTESLSGAEADRTLSP